MSKLLKPLVIFAVVLALGIAGWRQYSQDRAGTNVFSGTIEARESRIGSRVGGRVARLLVREGDTVTKGQRLIEFDPGELREDLAAAEAAGRQAREALRELQAGTRPEQISRLEAAERQARSQLQKLQSGSRPEEIAAARAAVEQARAMLQKLERGPRPEEIRRALSAVDSAAADRQLAQQSLKRTQDLYREGAIALQARDEAERQASVALAREKQAREMLAELKSGTRSEDLRAAKEALNEAQQRYRLVQKGPRSEDVAGAEAGLQQAKALLAEGRSGPRPQQIAQAKAAVEQADARARSLKIRLAERAVSAPRTGRIQILSCEVGDMVTAGQPVASLIDPADIFVRFYIPASRLRLLHVGDTVRIDTDDGRQATGTVEQIPDRGEFTPRNRQTKEDRDLEVFAVKVRISNPDGQIRAGMSANMRVAR